MSITQEIAQQAEAAGIELGAELEAEVRESTPNQQVSPAETQTPPVQDIDPVIQQLQALETTTAPKQDVVPEAKTEPDDMAWLDLPEDLGVVETEPVATLPDTPEVKAFTEQFQQYLGFSVDELREGVKSFQQMKAELQQRKAEVEQQKVARAAEDAKQQLRNEWGLEGQDFDTRMKQVLDRFSKYPAEIQSKLDNTEGARLIWAKIQQEQALKSPSVPTFERSRSMTGTAPRALFTESQIQKMPQAEYERLIDKIDYARMNGLVAQG